VIDAKTMMRAADPRHGRYLTASGLSRAQNVIVQNKNLSYVAEWNPNSTKTSLKASDAVVEP